MLEASSFDFRNRHPQHLLIKLAKHFGYARDSDVVRTAYAISLDLYRTFAPLKQITAILAFACLELAGRLCDDIHDAVTTRRQYEKWKISRSEVMGEFRLLLSIDCRTLVCHEQRSLDILGLASENLDQSY